MKKTILTLLFAIFIALGSFAQKLTYQAAIRNHEQQLVTNTSLTATVVVKVNEVPVYNETIVETTNMHGLLDIQFGDASFYSIDWPNATISVQVKNTATDEAYIPIEDRPVNAVPYALYAHNVTELESAMATMQNEITELRNTMVPYSSFNSFIEAFEGSYGDLINQVNILANLIAELRHDVNSLFETVENISHGSGGDFSCGTSKVKDHEGNEYNTVKIGNQCWTKENMRCITSPRTGTNILENTPSKLSVTGKKAYYPNGSASNVATYGLLYNWNAAVDTFNTSYGETSNISDNNNAVDVVFSGNRRGICPKGWHVPSKNEWTQLINYLGTQNDYTCGGDNRYTAKALASTTGWNSNTNTCAVGNNPSANNFTGYTAEPAGANNVSFVTFKERAHFWLVSQENKTLVWQWYLSFSSAEAYRGLSFKDKAYSVRCIRDDE